MSGRPFLFSFLLPLVFLGSALLNGCTKEENYQLGFIGELSGTTADLGVAGRNGAILAIEEQNSAGGIHGRKIDLQVRDSTRDAAQSRTALQQLLDQKIKLIIGPMTSSIASSLLSLINQSDALLLSPTVTSTAFTGKDDNFFRVIGDTSTYGKSSARYQYNTKKRRTFSAIYDASNLAYSDSWLYNFRQEFEKLGGKTLDLHPFIPNAANQLLDETQTLLSHNPDTVVVIASAIDAALISQQIYKINPKQAIVLAEWASTEHFIELAGNAAEGITTGQFMNRNNDSERYTQFRQAYIKRFGDEPGFAAVTAYDAALLAMRALDEQKPGQTLKQTILEIGTINGVQSPIQIDQFGDAQRNSYITEIRNNRYVTLEEAR